MHMKSLKVLCSEYNGYGVKVTFQGQAISLTDFSSFLTQVVVLQLFILNSGRGVGVWGCASYNPRLGADWLSLQALQATKGFQGCLQKWGDRPEITKPSDFWSVSGVLERMGDGGGCGAVTCKAERRRGRSFLMPVTMQLPLQCGYYFKGGRTLASV